MTAIVFMHGFFECQPKLLTYAQCGSLNRDVDTCPLESEWKLWTFLGIDLLIIGWMKG